MKAEIISIGTELLLGSILNTNARFLSQKLAENAIDVYHETTVGDNTGRIVEAFENAAGRADILISSGGLGPTEDDVTLQALCQFLKRPPVFHKPTYRYIRGRLKSHHLPMTRLVAKQCYVPAGSVILRNEKGTAPGILCRTVFEGLEKWVLVLPGPPKEMEPMWTRQALPKLVRLAKIKKEHFVIRSVKITGMTEAQVAQKITPILKMRPPVTAGIYARPGEVEIKIMAKSASRQEAARGVDRIEQYVRRRLGRHIFGIDQQTLAEVAGTRLKRMKKTLSVAESCTGGLLSKRITDIPGSSDIFTGGVICYSNRVKSLELGIDPRFLKKHGAVSMPVAKKMAQSVRKKFGTDWGIAITGIAGPSGGSRKKPVGLVYIALADWKGAASLKKIFLGSRSDIRSRAVDKALDFLRLKLPR